MDSSLPGSSVHGILQARVLGGLSFPSPGDLPDPGIEPKSPALQADALPSEPPGKPQVGLLHWLGIKPGSTAWKAAMPSTIPPMLKVKEESEKVGLMLNIQKTEIMASGLITSWELDGETVETVPDFIFWGLQNNCR